MLTPMPVIAATGAETLVGSLGVLFLIGAGIVATIVYFVPSIIAFRTDKANKIPILIVNFVFGWSLLGWIVALVWALSKGEAQPQQIVIHQTITGSAQQPAGYSVEKTDA
jgi:hypothetical protein